MKRKPPYSCRGITLIELSFVTAIAAVLMAMILGLSQHVSAISDIRRAQTDLAAWHQAMDNWHETFGEYPGEIIDGNTRISVMTGNDYLSNLSNVYHECYTVFYPNTMTGVYFKTYCTLPVKIKDPWGTPYIYLRDEGRQSYQLFSCGPDADTELLPSSGGAARKNDTTLDDIFFER